MDETGSISGVVRDAATGALLESVLVSLDGNRSVQTDTHGRYEFASVNPGTHVLRARAKPANVGQTTWPEQSRNVRVEGAGEAKADFALARLASIAGTVLDEDGKPAKAQMVIPVSKRFDAGTVAYTRLGSTQVVSNAEGRFRLDGLPAGEPLLLFTGRVVAEPPSGAAEGKPIAVDTYYPHSVSPDAAEPIVLAPDEIRSRVDIRIAAMPAYCVSGAVRGTNFYTGITVSKPGPILLPFHMGVLNQPADFRVCGLMRGDYLFTFQSGDGTKAALQAAENISVGDRDLTGIRVSLLPERTLPIRFEWDKSDTQPIEWPKASVVIRTILGQGIAVGAPTGVPGLFQAQPPIKEPFFDYAASLEGSAPEAYLKDILYGGASVLHRFIHPAGGDLTFVFGRDGATLLATAMSGEHPQPDASIAIMPVDSQSEADFAAATVFGKADQSGAWTSPKLAPGKYLALAANETLDTKVFHIDRLWAARPRAQEIELAPNSTLQVKLTVQDLGNN